MQLFSLQLSHCENTFSAKGLNVDATLLTKIIGGITTYILILIQLLFMSSSCGGKSMRLFSLQISHCENTFSAKGLTVDATLLTEIAGAIITYVLILIQFLFISSSCGGKTLKDTLYLWMRLFSLQLSHCENTFSAKGLTVDATLLTAVYLALFYECVLLDGKRHYHLCIDLDTIPMRLFSLQLSHCENTFSAKGLSVDATLLTEMRLFSLQLSHCENTFSAKGLTVDATLLTEIAGAIVTYLQLFSLQLSHCENTFSAKGLTVDATLLTKMVGGVTTYILQLFSLQLSHCKNTFSAKGVTVDATLLTAICLVMFYGIIVLDDRWHYHMQLFSLQLSHCKNTFSAKGLTVDATLLTKMAGSIATYLVILIQFLFMSNSCDG
ncbi:hypothetical protein DBV15_04236 [Temnothorax longispinosus]|uniref:Gustatory receptor n=1 Tax=Temnothorax longispinosus TaxID=300112 RepID=A0A4S2KQW6_9HYME|nr:hypothetical protein DBV15_04236 [Temnothorax longispinosus]